jgi:hypothetical protein
MKRILSVVFMATIAQTGFAYVPQNGPLNLGDQTQATRSVNTARGVIMNTLLTNPDLAEDVSNIYQFLGTPRSVCLPTYEDIVDAIDMTTYNAGAIRVIEAFEKAIMRYLHYNLYLCYAEGKNINIFFTGIKYSWFYPSAWINPASWSSSCDSVEAMQLINELEQLSNIASKHSTATANRLKLKISAYRNWKQNTLVFMGVLTTIKAGLYIKNKFNA